MRKLNFGHICSLLMLLIATLFVIFAWVCPFWELRFLAGWMGMVSSLAGVWMWSDAKSVD